MSKPNKTKSLYISLPEHIHRAAKAIAALEGRLLSDVVTDAISAYVASRFPQLGGNLGSAKSSGNPESPKFPREPKSPKSPKSPQARTGPGSPGYVAPRPVAVEDEEPLCEPLPIAGDDENPFQDDGTDDDLLPDERG
ncbi:MAG: hypothetical protein AMXMBFR56_53270 [Polyangiaceae bacterium]